MAARRRIRYAAKITPLLGTEIQDIHILAYTMQGAVDLMNRRGYQVLEIEPYKRTVERAKASGGFKIDQKALAEAIEFLGLKLKVRIRFNSRYGSVRGNYKRDNLGHDIMVKSYLSPEQASRTLWHELTHAMQSERAGSVWDWNVAANEKRPGRKRRIEYRNRPIEVEAREYEQYAEIIQIAVSA